MGGIDIVGPLNCTERGYKYILVFIDLFISWVEAAPMRSLTAKEVLDLLFKMTVSRHGCPHKILTDQGTQFKSEECYVSDLILKRWRQERILSSATVKSSDLYNF
jgi:hypothetical protein